ncbi:hypothetical protein AA0112_g5312 [Alternaria arborescens]|nr:hypothetical protein AA0112_g5312 [Alternaria arborescens]
MLGVSATPCGATVVSKAGFQERDYVRYTPLTTTQKVQQDNLYTAGFELWIGVRLPSGKCGTGGGIATCSESPTISSSASATSSV